MDVTKANFTFSGVSGQSLVKTQSFAGDIEEVFLVAERYTGKANKTCRWDKIGNILQVRCTFWGWGGSSGTAYLGFNVYHQARRAAAREIPEVRSEVFAVDLRGVDGQEAEHVQSGLDGKLQQLEIVGCRGDAADGLAVEKLDDDRFAVRAQLPPGTEETVYVAAVLDAA